MWQIFNATPFAAAQTWIRGLDGAETWLVVVKATFDILSDGSTQVAAEQPSVNRTAEYWGEPGASSIRYENDFVLAKLTTDIVVNGTVYAPGGERVEKIEAGFRVGELTKLIEVTGDRIWRTASLRMSEPTPFVSMPIRYERAFGGVDRESQTPEQDFYWPNPVGVGFARSRSAAVGLPLPNIELRGAAIRSWDHRPAPAGLGFIASHWEQRARLAGTYDEIWESKRQPLLPEDFELRHFQSAPVDQQTKGFLTGGESVALLNLSPAGMLRFELPRVELAMRSRFMDGQYLEHEMPKLHTVILEPDYPRVSLVFHSAQECHRRVYQLDRTRIDIRAEQRSVGDEESEELLGL